MAEPTAAERLVILAHQVQVVRGLQKKFFRGDKTVIDDAKRPERQLDAHVAEILSPSPQKELF